ncbi:MAG: hypothetical protein KC766_00955 [Myxococcales bacterium]|nr:hypothetical protein [Myxococcales bacterium]
MRVWIQLVALLAITACGGSTQSDSRDAGGSSGSGGSGGSGGDGSGGVAGAATRECLDSGGWCAFTDNTCGKSVDCFCQPQRPESCDESESFVCGCDGNAYRSECEAQRAGVDIHRDEWACTPGEGQTECGWLRCGSQTVCQVSYTDRPGPSGYACVHVGQCNSCDCVEPNIEDPTVCSCVDSDTKLPHIECRL